MAEERLQQQWQRRHYRQRRDIFNEYSDSELVKRFRLDRAGIIAVTDLVMGPTNLGSHFTKSVTLVTLQPRSCGSPPYYKFCKL
ncbi:hypothetical protein E2C01_044075 [Portunus trituberculatus]|uniref:Uncharacterized protein n=1 Tax=Portunus trituberculatus TaxID=210409 RepID=A0A5B7FS58_PORTR|nr:hypothetical protein [Portunus trituberculatus]